MSMAYACDRDGCDTFQRQELARGGWLSVEELCPEDARVWHYCSADCLLIDFAKRPPGVEIPFHQGG